MRHALKFAAIAITLLTVGFGAQAKSNKKQATPPSREQFVQIQANEIAEDLHLDDSTAKQFVATFTKCQQEIWNCGPKKELNRKQRNAKVTTDAEAEKIIKERFKHRNKINAIQEKYYKEYSKFLNQRQILKLYELENKMMRKMFREHAKGSRKGARAQKARSPRCNATPCPAACNTGD